MNDQPAGLCLSCGQGSMVMRLDKKLRPYLICRTCSTRLFSHVEGGCVRWLSALTVLAETPSRWAEDYNAACARISEWSAARLSSEVRFPVRTTTSEAVPSRRERR